MTVRTHRVGDSPSRIPCQRFRLAMDNDKKPRTTRGLQTQRGDELVEDGADGELAERDGIDLECHEACPLRHLRETLSAVLTPMSATATRSCLVGHKTRPRGYLIAGWDSFQSISNRPVDSRFSLNGGSHFGSRRRLSIVEVSPTTTISLPHRSSARFPILVERRQSFWKPTSAVDCRGVTYHHNFLTTSIIRTSRRRRYRPSRGIPRSAWRGFVAD